MTKENRSREIREKLISTCGHDVRSLLFSSNGLARLLLKRKRDSGDNEKEIETLERIVNAGDKAIMETKALMSFLKFEQNEMDCTRKPVEAEELFHNFDTLFAPFLNEKKLTFETVIPDQLPPFLCTVHKAREIIQHLAIAGIGLAEPETVISFQVAESPGAGSIVLSVGYYGEIVPSEQQATLFEKPLVINGFTLSVALPLCNEYVQEEDGTLEYRVISENHGSFVITFPVFDPEHSEG